MLMESVEEGLATAAPSPSGAERASWIDEAAEIDADAGVTVGDCSAAADGDCVVAADGDCSVAADGEGIELEALTAWG